MKKTSPPPTTPIRAHLKSAVSISTVALLAGLCAAPAFPDSPELAVVVNKANTADSISSNELRQMILGEKTKWQDGKKAVAVETPAESSEKSLVLKLILKMPEAALKRYYMQAAFTGKEVAAPKDVPSATALKQFVAGNPGAVGCILASQVDEKVKVLKVDGVAPGEDGYKLK